MMKTKLDSIDLELENAINYMLNSKRYQQSRDAGCAIGNERTIRQTD